MTVKQEEEQNEKLLDLSEQILALTKEVRGFASLAQGDHDRNEELLEMSRRTLASSEALHESTARGEHGGRGS